MKLYIGDGEKWIHLFPPNYLVIFKLDQIIIKDHLEKLMQQNRSFETQEFLNAILMGLPYGIVVVDLTGEILLCNQRALRRLSIDREVSEVIKTSIFVYLEKIPVVKDILEKCLIRKELNTFNFVALPFHGRYLTINGRFISRDMVITVRDVTETKENELNNLNTMLEGQEMERKRLSREIHDGIGPLMSTIKLHLDAIRSELHDVSDKVLKKIDVMDELIREVAHELRNVSHDLMPSSLEDLGLVAALDNLCQKANQSEKVQVEFYHVGMKERLNPKMALGIFRIAQELLNNAFKYARASTISVQLIRYPDSVLLMVEDDGIGFDKADLEKLIHNGIGIQNIQTRTRALGGHFHVDARKNKGVLVTIELPLNI